MILRLFALVVLVALAGGGYLYWKNNPSLTPPRNLGEAREQLEDAGVTGAVKTALALASKPEAARRSRSRPRTRS